MFCRPESGFSGPFRLHGGLPFMCYITGFTKDSVASNMWHGHRRQFVQ